jgi:hypothetical protein
MSNPPNLKQTQIKNRAISLKSRIDKLNERYKELQQICNHPNKTSKRDGTGSMWCKDDEAYWINHYCPDCDKRWTTDQ